MSQLVDATATLITVTFSRQAERRLCTRFVKSVQRVEGSLQTACHVSAVPLYKHKCSQQCKSQLVVPQWRCISDCDWGVTKLTRILLTS